VKRCVKKNKNNWVLVAHTYNPSFSGGKDQKDHGSKSALSKQFTRSYLENIQQKKGLAEWLQQ
jgi:hypothetical protein